MVKYLLATATKLMQEHGTEKVDWDCAVAAAEVAVSASHVSLEASKCSGADWGFATFVADLGLWLEARNNVDGALTPAYGTYPSVHGTHPCLFIACDPVHGAHPCFLWHVPLFMASPLPIPGTHPCYLWHAPLLMARTPAYCWHVPMFIALAPAYC
eukprot:1162077-Pelagomonas_calceolata.AAC.13